MTAPAALAIGATVNVTLRNATVYDVVNGPDRHRYLRVEASDGTVLVLDETDPDTTITPAGGAA